MVRTRIFFTLSLKDIRYDESVLARHRAHGDGERNHGREVAESVKQASDIAQHVKEGVNGPMVELVVAVPENGQGEDGIAYSWLTTDKLKGIKIRLCLILE